MTDHLLLKISNISMFIGFILLLISLVPLGMSISSKRSSRYANIAIWIVTIAFILELTYFVFRWLATGHAPVSNLFEFIAMFSIMLIFGYLVTYHYYKTKVFGLFAIPVSLLLLWYGALFSTDVAPLIPALQSNWLAIHVITVTISYGILSMSAVAGFIYLLKIIPENEKSWRSFFLETITYFIIVIVTFMLMMVLMRGVVKYEADFFYVNQQGNESVVTYNLPSLINYKDSIPVEHLGNNEYDRTEHFTTGIEVPPIIKAHSLNTVIWSIGVGLIVYGLLRLILRRRIYTLLKPVANKADLNLMDDIGYRSVIIGFPLFALGGIFFAAIWAQAAWSRFWGWDPKETWAFITFMFYTIFLHLRINRGYEGEKSAWLAVAGFFLILFNLVAINLIVAGLHSYA
ncbi:c-type cytochrome biogenesis protein CcsB [Nosocomiicoccus sp. HMSC059G07]|uniref:c-type cytochrome biogenesis protein CcsB n=1 Tax=Nosocomiicoccus sp. HMSC059G07 TaxID=1739531 RepID=UPI0008A2747B|nr:c-type cytochrome biogenesis protein CcsB [Nosocomiicoccus sp. HMSC059G07]OFO55459.1 c-type cytochrome biogenesis protein CcsB [Nosocomiicoccus sp. HMSC059G07]